jgi:hypothetical protein
MKNCFRKAIIEDHEQLLRSRETNVALSKKLGVSDSTVRLARIALGIPQLSRGRGATRLSNSVGSPLEYAAQRALRGTQESVSAQLGVHPFMLSKRERGTPDAPITREAWLALLSLPKKRNVTKPQNE